MTRLAAIGAVAFTLIGLAVGAWFAFERGGSQFADCGGGMIAGGQADIGGPFTLVDQDGKTVTDKEVIDKPSLLYFGYTFCPDICPIDTAKMAEATERLEENGVIVRPVFITIDPARDTPEVLKAYVGNMHPRMVGLTGTQAQIDKVTKEFRVYAKKVGKDPNDYQMDHSAMTYLMAPGHGLLEIFRQDQTAEEIAKKTQCYVEHL